MQASFVAEIIIQMAQDIDTEFMVSLIEVIPVLWNKTMDLFKDRIATRNTGREVCLKLKPYFEDLEDAEKNSFGKEIIKRWTNLRDVFVGSNKKINECKTSGFGGETPKKYVFNDKLQFLEKLYTGAVTVDSFDADACKSVEDMEHDTEGATGSTNIEVIHQRTKAVPSRARKHRKPDEVELKILEALETGKHKSKLSFFHSVLPYLDQYDENDMLEFQMCALQVIPNINQKKKKLSCQPSLPRSAQSIGVYQLPQLPTNTYQPHSLSSNSAAEFYQHFSLSSGLTSQEGCARKISTPLSSESSTTINTVDFTSL